MKQKSIKINFIMNAILQMSSFIFPLITFPYISRVLQPAGKGEVTFAISVITYFSMFANLGIPTYGIRACARVRDNKGDLTRVAHELLLINLIMSVVSYGLLAIGIVAVPRLNESKTLLIVVSASILLNAIGMEWLYKALEQYTYITIRSVIFKGIAVIAMLLLVRSKDDGLIYGALSIFAASASNILNFINVHRYISLKPVGGLNLKRHLKPVFVFFAMACATTVYTNLDTVMLGFMKTQADVGYYDAAVKVKTILVSIVTSLGSVLLPRASYYIENDMPDEFRRITKKAINFVMIAALPLTVYFVLFANEGIILLSGDAYIPAVGPMRIIMPTLIFIGLSNILGIQMLVPLGREKVVLFSEIAGAVVDLILNALFIPKLGAAGAALGTLAAEAVVLLWQYAALRRDVNKALACVSYIRILAALAAGCASCIWVKLLDLGSFMTLLISAILFFSIYIGLLYITKESFTREVCDSLFRKIKRLLLRR